MVKIYMVRNVFQDLTIESRVMERTKIYLEEYLKDLRLKKEDRISKHISSNPQLRAVPKYYPEIYNEFDLNSSPEKLNEILYKYKGRVDFDIRNSSKKLLKTQQESLIEISENYKKITERLEAVQKDDLAGYLVLRKLIIDLLERKIQSDKLDQYQKEEIIHDIIFPRRITTDEISFDNVNLWLIDDTLIFHEFAASDPRLKDISSSDSENRPDIIIFSTDEKNDNVDAVSIFELKRPQRENYEKDPIKQMTDIIDKISEKEIFRQNGRPLLTDDTTKFYCYAICDINENIEQFAKKWDMKKLKHNFGYYKYHEAVQSPYSDLIIRSTNKGRSEKTSNVF